MKKLLLSLLILSAFSLVFVFTNKVLNLKHSNSVEDDFGINDKFKWQTMRLRDISTGEIPHNIRAKELAYASTLPGSLNNSKFSNNYQLSNQWNQRGPINVGGRTRALAIDLKNTSRILAGGVSGGMWLSNDDGQSWQRTTALNQLSSVSCVVQDKRSGKENIWYYGTGEFWGNSADISGNGIFKSTDAGQTWNVLSATTTGSLVSWDNPFDYVWNMAINHKNSTQDEVLAATCAGAIMRSIDGGKNWTPVLGGYGNDRSIFTDITISPNGVFYATLSQRAYDAKGSVTKGIYRSVDGIKWTNITPQFMPAKYNRIVIGISPSDENQIYFLAETPGSGLMTRNIQGDTLWHGFWKYTYKSGDGTGAGAVWEERSLNLPKPLENIRGQINSQGSYDLVITVKPDNPEVVFIGGTNVYRTTDGFKTPDNYTWVGGYNNDKFWSPDYSVYPNHHPDIHALVFHPNNSNVLYTGSDGGVHKTLDCLEPAMKYVDLNKAYYTTQFYSIAIDHSKVDDRILGGLQDNGTLLTKSSNVNDAWTSPTGSDGFNCAISSDPNIIYTSHNSMAQPKIKVWRLMLDDNGNVVTKTRIDPDGGRNFIWNTPFKLDPSDNNRMYLAGGKILWRNKDLRSIPMQTTKDSTSIGWDSLPQTRILDTAITAVGISKIPANVVYYGTSQGKIYRIDNANTTADVTNITKSNLPKGYISSVSVNPNDSKMALISFNNYNMLSVFLTTDAGSTWTAVSGNLEEIASGAGNGPAVNWISILPVKGKNIFLAGTSTGLYATAYLDGMNTVWIQEGSESIGNSVVDMIDVRDIDGLVAVGTHGLGTFTANITDLPAVPAVPVLSSPTDGKRGIKTDVKLSWKSLSNAYFYKIEISKYPDFSNVIQTIGGIKDTTYSLQNLEQGLIKYYWRVFGTNSGGLSLPSDVWSLTTLPAAPELVYPPASAENIPVNVTLSWNPANGATLYHLQVSKSLTFGTIIIDTSIAGTTFLLSKLEESKRYYWRVSSKNEDGEGVSSKNFNFKTIISASVASDFNPEFRVNIMYPNPCKGDLAIEFNLPGDGKVDFVLIDLLGVRQIPLESKFFTKGNNFIDVNLKNVNQGFYSLAMSFNGKIISQKISIIK